MRRIIPPLLNDFIGLQKDTALISVLGMLDAFNRRRFVNNSTATLAAVHHGCAAVLSVTIPFTRWLDGLMRRQQRDVGGAIVDGLSRDP